jgi:hypothetical protein
MCLVLIVVTNSVENVESLKINFPEKIHILIKQVYII